MSYIKQEHSEGDVIVIIMIYYPVALQTLQRIKFAGVLIYYSLQLECSLSSVLVFWWLKM